MHTPCPMCYVCRNTGLDGCRASSPPTKRTPTRFTLLGKRSRSSTIKPMRITDQKPRLKSTPHKIITKCHCNLSPVRQTTPSSKDTLTHQFKLQTIAMQREGRTHTAKTSSQMLQRSQQTIISRRTAYNDKCFFSNPDQGCGASKPEAGSRHLPWYHQEDFQAHCSPQPRGHSPRCPTPVPLMAPNAVSTELLAA